MDSSSYTSYIPLDYYTEEVRLIKDINKPDKFSVRNLDQVISDLVVPTMILRKGRQPKEKIPFMTVSEYRQSEALDIIELRSDTGKTCYIRIKSRESMKRWVDYLKTFLPPSDNEYEIPDYRDRSSTNTVHNRPPARRTPRTPGSVQSVVDMVPTTFTTPVSAQHFEDSRPEGAESEIATYVNLPGPYRSSFHKDYSSLRSTEEESIPEEIPEDIYQEVEGAEAHTMVDVNAIPNRPPVPPKRVNPVMNQTFSSRGNVQANIKDIMNSELRDALSQRKNSFKPKPSFTADGLRADSDIVETNFDYREGASKGLYVVRRTTENPIAGPAMSTFKPAVPRRNGTVIRCHDARKREATIMEDFETPPTTVSSSSSDDDSDDDSQDDQNEENITIRKEIYAKNARRAMKCEMEQRDGITCHAELGQLQHLGIVTTQYGAYINDVPANLQRKFFHGDKIISINEQRIKDANFARSIIETSECKMVKVTVRRLHKGHFIQLERETIGSPEDLGFSLHNGPEIMYIAPGTMFAKQATGDMMSEKRCITHIENKFIPPGTSTKEVNIALRNAGYKFYIILQPVEFMQELMQQP